MAYTKLLFFLAWSCRKLWKYFMNTLINILSTFCPIFMFHEQKFTRSWILKADMSLCWVVLDYVVKRNEFILLNPYIALLCWYSLRCCSNFIWLHYSRNKLRFLPASTLSCFFLERKQKLTFGNFLKIFCQETVEKWTFERTTKEIWSVALHTTFLAENDVIFLHLYPWEKCVERFIFYNVWTDIDIVEREKTVLAEIRSTRRWKAQTSYCFTV